MKRMVPVLSVCLLLFSCLSVSAGSVPEDLLQSDEAQIFFAKVEEHHVSKGETVVELVPVVAVKGDVPLWSRLTYIKVVPIGNFSFAEGKAYLFAYYDKHNPTYAFRATGYDPETLSLVVPDEVRRNMFGRFEEYLNNGAYTAAEAERCQRLHIQPPKLFVDGELPPLDTGRRSLGLLVTGCGVILLAMIGWGIVYAVLWKKKPSVK